jgi:hypothetical protein
LRVMDAIKKFIVANLMAITTLALTASELGLSALSKHAAWIHWIVIGAVAPLAMYFRSRMCISEAEGRIVQSVAGWFRKSACPEKTERPAEPTCKESLQVPRAVQQQTHRPISEYVDRTNSGPFIPPGSLALVSIKTPDFMPIVYTFEFRKKKPIRSKRKRKS